MIDRRRILAAIACRPALASAPSRADNEGVRHDFPRGPVRYVVPAPPGGIIDFMARVVAQGLSESWKSPVVVDNRPGGNAMLGADLVAKSVPDGQTLLAISMAHAVYVTLMPEQPYDLMRDLAGVSVLASIPLVVTVPASSEIRDMAGLMRRLKVRPTNVGAPTSGSPSHLGTELLRRESGAGDLVTHVPYRGGPQVVSDLLGGSLDLSVANLSDVVAQIRDGKLHAVAVTSENRHPLLPSVPTVGETGHPNLRINNWTAMMVPAATPPWIRNRIAADAAVALRTPNTFKRVQDAGYELLAWDSLRSAAFIESEIRRWGGLVREAKLKLD